MKLATTLQAILDDLVGAGALLLQYPLLLAELALIGAILGGAGRAFGVPMLFWDQGRGRQVLAGGAVGFFVSETLFVAYALQAERGQVAGFERLDLEGSLAFLALVGLAVWVRESRRWSSRRGPWADSPTSGSKRAKQPGAVMAPTVNTVNGIAPSSATGARIHVWPFLTGFVLALCSVLAVRHIPFPGSDLRWQAAAIFGALSVAFLTLRRHATPAIGICTALALVAGAYGGLLSLTQSPGLGLLTLFSLLWFAGRQLYKVRLPTFEGGARNAYENPVAYPPPDGDEGLCDPAGGPLLPFDVGVQARSTDGARPLVVVCVSGGGIRAAAWTAAILEQLGAIPDFVTRTRLVTGASGGSLGATAWVAHQAERLAQGLDARACAVEDHLVDGVAADSLSAAARRLVFHDLPTAFAPWTNRSDRGLALELAWRENLNRAKARVDLARTVSSLRSLEEQGKLPSLVLSPMIVEDGRRLLITNLDLRHVTDNRVLWLSSKDSPYVPISGIASRTAYHVHEVVAGGAHLPLSTAARMAASFPYVSPAIVLPTQPRRRVIDAGYFDNYGLDLACAWLRHLVAERRETVRARVSRVLVVQIRDNVSSLSVNPESDRERARRQHPATAVPGPLSRGLEGLTSPPQGLLTARESVMLFRNDGQLGTVSQLYREVLQSQVALSTTIFEFSGEASLSWRLTDEERAGIKAQAASEGIRGKLDAIAAWVTAP